MLNYWHLADYRRVSDLQDFFVGVIEDWFTEGISWKNENEEGDYFEDFRAFIIAVLEDDTVRRTSQLYHFAIAIFLRFISQPRVTQDKRQL
ncbi:hypothetical protein DL765_010469 [Monosporascus sp. GIB2]|nr:hypothetical protein DL765_010469 [Monosporascus sp. GIB2]